MSKQKFTMSVKLANAVSLVMQNEPKDWGSNEHSAMIRYLVLQCSDKAKNKPGQDKSCIVDLTLLKEEFGKTAKLFEASNFKKTLADGDFPQFKTDHKTTDYV